MIVHILRAGRALCDMDSNIHKWPEGHRWVSRPDKLPSEVPASALCPKCVKVWSICYLGEEPDDKA